MSVRVSTFALVLALWAAPGLSQSSRGVVRGVVLDPSAVPLGQQLVELVSEATAERREAVTGVDGEFVIALVPPGRHRLEVGADGYKRFVQRVEVQVAQDVRATVVLEIGVAGQLVEVNAPFAGIRRDTAAVGAVIDNRLVTGLPLDGRNFLELSLLVPGTAPAAQGSASSVRGDFAFTANGGREDANSFVLDGADNLDPKLNAPGVRPPVDAIEEFEVLTSSYEAEYGRQAAGQVNVVLKSGGNSLRGTGYGFFRDGRFDARNFFVPEGEAAPGYARRQIGLSMGGPIARNRTFLFADYERTRSREGITRVTTVPTARERVGDFSQSAVAPVNPFTGQPFPGHQIPEFFQHPVGRAIAALYPLPNRAGTAGNFVSSPEQRDDDDHVDLRLTHVFGPSSTLTVRYSLADRRLFEPFSGTGFSSVPGFGTEVPRRGQNLVVSETRVFSPTFVNEVRVAWNRVSASATPQNQGVSLNQQVGLPEFWSDPRDSGLSFITVTGLSPLGDEYNNPQQSTTNTFQVANTATWTRGRHLARFGVDLRAVRQEAFRDVQARGFLQFSDRYLTGNALADLLLGFPMITGGARFDNPQRLRTESLGLFAQDTWRVRPDLTITAGLRYELISPPVDADDRATLYDPSRGSLVPVGQDGMPRSGYDADRNNLAPRVGVAWTLPTTAETVLRAGYGVFYNQSALAPSEGLYFSAPYYNFNFYFPLPGMPLTLSDPFPAGFPFPLPQSALAFQRDLRTPYMHHWSASVQRQIGRSAAAEVAYVGTRGRDLIRARDLNQPPPSPGPFPIRPNPAFDDITAIESAARSRYDALQLRVQQRQDFGLTLLASYTLAKSMDDASGFFSSAGDPNFPQDSNDPGAEWGRSAFDVRHRLSVSFAYDLPLRTSAAGTWVSALLADWQVSGVVTLQSGRPFTVALLPEFDNSNTGRSVLGFGANDRPNLVGNPTLDAPGPERWFDTTAFVVPPRGTFGDAGRNRLEGPGYANVNLALIRRVAAGDRLRFELRLEAFNLLNRANFNQPDNFVGSPTFGQILSAGSPRHLQLGVKAIF